MRQVGVLAAAGLVALDSMTERLAEDHANARLLAEMLADVPGIHIGLPGVQTNIVIFRLRGGRDASGMVAALQRKGILTANIGSDAIRLVTHRDVSRSQCEVAARQIGEELLLR